MTRTPQIDESQRRRGTGKYATPRRWSVTFTQTRRATVAEPDLTNLYSRDNFPDLQAAALLDLARQAPSVIVEDSTRFQEAHPVTDDTHRRGTDALARAIENTERDPFTRRRLSAIQVRTALADLDAQRADVAAALALFQTAHDVRTVDGYAFVSEPLGDAWNALHDAADALDRLRAKIEDNPRPIPEHERGTYELVMQNID